MKYIYINIINRYINRNSTPYPGSATSTLNSQCTYVRRTNSRWAASHWSHLKHQESQRTVSTALAIFLNHIFILVPKKLDGFFSPRRPGIERAVLRGIYIYTQTVRHVYHTFIALAPD